MASIQPSGQQHHETGIARRIRVFRSSVPGCSTQAAFAKALGIDQQRLSGYENGTRVPHPVIAGMVRMGANPYWLLFGEGSMRTGSGPAERGAGVRVLNVASAAVAERQLAEFYVLPLYASEDVVARPFAARKGEIEGPAIIHQVWCPNPECTDYVRVQATGDAMAPTIPAGAIVTIDRSRNDPDTDDLVGRIVALGLAEGGVLLRRLQRTARGGHVGVPDNPSAANRAVAVSDDDHVLGLVQTVHALIG